MKADTTNRLLGASFEMIAFEPKAAVLRIFSDEGSADFVVNRFTAQVLLMQMVDFLGLAEGDPASDDHTAEAIKWAEGFLQS